MPVGWNWSEYFPEFTLDKQIKVLSSKDRSVLGTASLDSRPFQISESSFLGSNKTHVQTVTSINDGLAGSGNFLESPIIAAILMRAYQTSQSSVFIPVKDEDADIGIPKEMLQNVGFSFEKIGRNPKKKTGWYLNSVGVTSYGMLRGFEATPHWGRGL